MYMFTLNSKKKVTLVISILQNSIFSISFSVPFLLRYSSALSPYQTRCKSVPWDRREMGVTRDLQGNYIGITNSPMISGAATNLDKFKMSCATLSQIMIHGQKSSFSV